MGTAIVSLGLAFPFEMLTVLSMYISTRTDITVAKCLECKQARFAQQTEVLVKTLTVLAASPVLDEFLGYVLRSLAQQLGLQSGGIWLYDQAYHTTILQIDYEDGQIRRGEDILRPGASRQKRLQQWDTEYMPLLMQNQILIQDVQNLPQPPEYALTQTYNQQRGIKTIMVIPLLFGDMFLGNITLRSTQASTSQRS